MDSISIPIAISIPKKENPNTERNFIFELGNLIFLKLNAGVPFLVILRERFATEESPPE